jgi:hypothetical protein
MKQVLTIDVWNQNALKFPFPHKCIISKDELDYISRPFQKKNLCFTYDPPLYKLPFLCKRHSLSERKEENNEENELNPDFAKNEGGRVMEKEANPFFPHRPSGHWQKKTFGLHSPEILLGP